MAPIFEETKTLQVLQAAPMDRTVFQVKAFCYAIIQAQTRQT